MLSDFIGQNVADVTRQKICMELWVSIQNGSRILAPNLADLGRLMEGETRKIMGNRFTGFARRDLDELEQMLEREYRSGRR